MTRGFCAGAPRRQAGAGSGRHANRRPSPGIVLEKRCSTANAKDKTPLSFNAIEPLLEGALILLMGSISLAMGRPLLFASLGPTAYEQTEKPELPSARIYNVIVGHWSAIGAGFSALALTHAWSAPNPLTTGHFVAVRVWACVIAVALSVLFCQLLKASQPAASATAILIAIGSMQNPDDAWAIAVAVVILGVVGEPIRRWRLKEKNQSQAQQPRAA